MSCAKDARAEADSASAESLCLPAALVGCGDGGVYAYGVEYGRVLGRLDAFSPEAVSALASPSESATTHSSPRRAAEPCAAGTSPPGTGSARSGTYGA